MNQNRAQLNAEELEKVAGGQAEAMQVEEVSIPRGGRVTIPRGGKITVRV
ncbi:MAG: hypothetical protein K6B72_03455 [Lachnospiraceae bacterium]|nr:hypothetical protein [Lachnospiraceae bacterium]